MAGEEVQEVGGTAATKAEDPVATVPEMVIVCEACGKGFLTWIPGGMDVTPLWQMGNSEGYICGGPLAMIGRDKALMGAEKWLEEQQKQ